MSKPTRLFVSLVELQVELIAIVHSHFGHRIYHTVTAGNAPLPLGNDTWHEVADISSGPAGRMWRLTVSSTGPLITGATFTVIHQLIMMNHSNEGASVTGEINLYFPLCWFQKDNAPSL